MNTQAHSREIESWQKMMFSCRKACKILRVEFSEPEFLNWDGGRSYHERLWNKVGVLSLRWN